MQGKSKREGPHVPSWARLPRGPALAKPLVAATREKRKRAGPEPDGTGAQARCSEHLSRASQGSFLPGLYCCGCWEPESPAWLFPLAAPSSPSAPCQCHLHRPFTSPPLLHPPSGPLSCFLSMTNHCPAVSQLPPLPVF